MEWLEGFGTVLRVGVEGTGGLRLPGLRARLRCELESPFAGFEFNHGHSSITVTMDRYTHLFRSDIAVLIGRLEDIRTRNLAAQPRPNDRSRGIDIGGR